MTDMPALGEIVGALTDAFAVLTPAEQELAAAAYRLIALGHPVDVGELAVSGGWAVDDAAAWLAQTPGAYIDDEGRLVGFWGLATEAVSAHELDIAGNTTWAWCALDPLFIAPAIGVEPIVHSVCPVSGEAIRLRITERGVEDLSPLGAVMSLRIPDGVFDADVRTSFCHFVHYLASPAAGDSWRAQHPDTFVLPINDAGDVGRRLAQGAFAAVIETRHEEG